MATLQLVDPTQPGQPKVGGYLTTDYLSGADMALLGAAQGVLKRMYRDCKYDRQRYISGTAVPTTEFIIYSIPKGQTGAVANSSATTFTKTDIDTNMAVPNALPRDEVLICQSIQVLLEFVGAIDTTITNGEALNPTPTGTPGSVTNNMRCASFGATVQLVIGSAVYEYGPIWEFPAGPYAKSGFAGAGISTTSTESFIQNGIGRARMCNPWHVIDAGRQFLLKLNWRDAWTPQTLFYMTFILDGVTLTAVQ